MSTTVGRSLQRCFLWVLAAVVLFLSASTLARVTDFWSRGPDATVTGTATVRACTEYGPISLRGFGTTYGCTAEVRWADGRTEVVGFPAGQLSPGGSDVPVFESRGGWRTGTGYGVNDSSRWYAIGAVAALGLLLAALAAAVAAALAAVAAVRGMRAEPAAPGYDGRPAVASRRPEPAGREPEVRPAETHGAEPAGSGTHDVQLTESGTHDVQLTGPGTHDAQLTGSGTHDVQPTGSETQPAGSGTHEVQPAESAKPVLRRPRMKVAWPVDATDRAAVPRGAVIRRVRLLIGWCLAAAALQLLSTIPRNDAPRARDFTSPWPQVERAWLVTPDDVGLAAADFGIPLLAAIAAVMLVALLRASTDVAARVVRYGEPFLATTTPPGKPRSVQQHLQVWQARRTGQLVRGRVYSLVILGLAAYALIHAITVLPVSAPLLVTIGGLRDALLLTALGVILLTTVEPKYDRLTGLLRTHEERARTGMGT